MEEEAIPTPFLITLFIPVANFWEGVQMYAFHYQSHTQMQKESIILWTEGVFISFSQKGHSKFVFSIFSKGSHLPLFKLSIQNAVPESPIF